LKFNICIYSVFSCTVQCHQKCDGTGGGLKPLTVSPSPGRLTVTPSPYVTPKGGLSKDIGGEEKWSNKGGSNGNGSTNLGVGGFFKKFGEGKGMWHSNITSSWENNINRNFNRGGGKGDSSQKESKEGGGKGVNGNGMGMWHSNSSSSWEHRTESKNSSSHHWSNGSTKWQNVHNGNKQIFDSETSQNRGAGGRNGTSGNFERNTGSGLATNTGTSVTNVTVPLLRIYLLLLSFAWI